MKDSDSSRSVLIMKAEGNEAIIEVSQPSDCLLLQRDHVQCSHVDILNVWFDNSFTNNINGLPKLQSSDTWKEALHHILDTYGPRHCTILASHTGIQDGHQVDLADGTSYRGFWNGSHKQLSIVR